MSRSFYFSPASLTLFVCLTVGIPSSAVATQDQGSAPNHPQRTGTLPPPPQNAPSGQLQPQTTNHDRMQPSAEPRNQASQAQTPGAASANQQLPQGDQQAQSGPQPDSKSQIEAVLQSRTPKAEPPTQNVNGITCPPEYVPFVQKTTVALMSEHFTFYPIKALDPFAPFIQPEIDVPQVRVSDAEPLEEMNRPLTPLQKMTISEIEKGLKAITWGDLGRKAVIEDSTGRGYIVAVGTPAGERSGVVTQIFNDSLVIQQEIWDRVARKRVPQDFIVKLSKKTDKL